MRIVFMGTPEFAVPSLIALSGRHEVPLVVTRPDSMSRRGRDPVPSPVRQAAESLGVPVLTAASFYLRQTPDPAQGGAASRGEGLRSLDEALLAAIANCLPDAIVVAAYGAILPKAVLEIPRLGCVNVHASLLPRWRGAAPIQRALLAGDETAGVSIMRMEEGLDTGPYCLQRSTPLADKHAPQLTAELAQLGAEALLAALGEIEDGSVCWTEQDDALASWADKIDKGELMLTPALDAPSNLLRVRAATASASARCAIANRQVTVLRAATRTAPVAAQLQAGEACAHGGRLLLGCRDGCLEVTELKPDGKAAMPAAAFIAGSPELRDGATARWS